MTVHPGIMLRKEDQRGELSYLYQIDDKDDNHISIAPHLGSVICVNNKQTQAVCKCPFGDPAKGFSCATGAVKCRRCWRNFHLSGTEISRVKPRTRCHMWLCVINVTFCCRVHVSHACLHFVSYLLHWQLDHSILWVAVSPALLKFGTSP